MKKISRRNFIKRGVATGAAVAAVSAFGQQAWYSKSPDLLGDSNGNRVVIIGGGWGGITTARELLRSGEDIEVVLVEQKPFFMSCPMSNLYLAGIKDLSYITFDYGNAIDEGMIFINERAMEIDRDAKVVGTGAGNISYDYLVMSPGIDYMEETIEGFSEAAHMMPVGFKPFEHIALRRKIEQFEGGDFIISVPKGPYRCPPGPYERIALLGHYLKENEIPGKITVLDSNNNPIAKADGFLAAYDDLYADQIDYIPNAEVIGVDYASKTVTTAELGEFTFDLANLIPQMKAGEIVRTAGLGDRWANVQQPNFISEMDDSVYLLGDVVGNMPVPKSGMVANTSGHIVGKHLAQRIAGTAVADIDVLGPSNICYSFVNETESIWVSAEYGLDEVENAIVRTDGGIDQERSFTNGVLASDWARGLWADMFGES